MLDLYQTDERALLTCEDCGEKFGDEDFFFDLEFAENSPEHANEKLNLLLGAIKDQFDFNDQIVVTSKDNGEISVDRFNVERR